MKNIEITSLPKLKFALSYGSDGYYNELPAESDFIEIDYVVEGNLTIRCDKDMVIAEKGDVICNMFETDRIFSAEGFQEHRAVGAYVSFRENSELAYGLELPFITKADKNISEIHRLIDELISGVYFYKNAPAEGGEKFLKLLCEISDYNKRKSGGLRSSDRLYTRRAKEFINANINRPITQKEVAKHLDITPEYLCDVFKKSEGMSIIKYVNTVKLQGVKTLMEKENLHLYEAAAHFGFGDPNYVSRLYRKYFGMNITE